MEMIITFVLLCISLFQPNGKLYESFSVFCPCDQLEHLNLLMEEDVLIDWSQPIYMNYTHHMIIERIEELYSNKGTVDKIYGDIFVFMNSPEDDSTNT